MQVKEGKYTPERGTAANIIGDFRQ